MAPQVVSEQVSEPLLENVSGNGVNEVHSKQAPPPAVGVVPLTRLYF